MSSCPYGNVGDLLWVRETWQAWTGGGGEYDDDCEPVTWARRGKMSWAEWINDYGYPTIEYRATSKSTGPWTPAIHMPRWASRITLEITEVRVQRLHDISEDDARAEGLALEPLILDGHAVGCFSRLWDEINGARAAWDSNPSVWAVSFLRVPIVAQDGARNLAEMPRPNARGILFKSEMVRAILAGTKTQTRRLVRQDKAP